MENPSQDLLALSQKEVANMKQKLPADLKSLPLDQLTRIYVRVEQFEKELENRMNMLRKASKPAEAEAVYRLMDEVFNIRVSMEDLVKPPTKEELQDEGNLLQSFTKPNNTKLSVEPALSFTPPIKPSAKGIPQLTIQDFESLSIKEPIAKPTATRGPTFVEFRKQWLATLLQDQAPSSDNEPDFAFRVVTGNINRGWQALPALPPGFFENYRGDTPLPEAYKAFRLFNIFLELNRTGYVSVAHMYNWKRKAIGAYRSLLFQPSHADTRAVRARSEQLFNVFLDHLNQSDDRIIHIDFFATAQDKVPLMVWHFSEETGLARAILQRETFISKSLNAADDNFFD
jgi:hypothetical protein